MKTLTATAILILLFLTACTAAPTEPVETTRIPATAVPIQPAPTKTPTPTPAATAPGTGISTNPNSDPTLPPPTPNTSVANTAPTVELLRTVEPTQTFVETGVSYVIALQGMAVYRSPAFEYPEIDTFLETEIRPVTGQSPDGQWWRVLCDGDIIGDCWVPAIYTHPVEGPTLEALLPDPATVAMASETAVPSPDGRWLATAAWSENVSIANQLIYYYATVIVSDGGTVSDGDTATWTPLAEWRPIGSDESTRPRILQWSDDGRYLYYTGVPQPEGCYIFVNGSNLTRLDTTDGRILEILPDHTTFNLALSPDQSWVAYISYRNQQSILVLQEIPPGPKHNINLTESAGYVQAGEIFWSADSTTAVLAVMHDPCYDAQTGSILRIDVESLTATPIIANDGRLFTIRDWPDPAQPTIRLTDKDGNNWRLDMDTGELSAE